MMSIKLSTRAKRDLDDIRDYTIENWGRDQWLKYYRLLIVGFESIHKAPDKGRDRSLFASGLRSLNCQKHVIFYKEITSARNAIVILRIVHQSRNLPALSYYDDLDASS